LRATFYSPFYRFANTNVYVANKSSQFHRHDSGGLEGSWLPIHGWSKSGQENPYTATKKVLSADLKWLKQLLYETTHGPLKSPDGELVGDFGKERRLTPRNMFDASIDFSGDRPRLQVSFFMQNDEITIRSDIPSHHHHEEGDTGDASFLNTIVFLSFFRSYFQIETSAQLGGGAFWSRREKLRRFILKCSDLFSSTRG
jgi:hypothetical protein